MKIGNNDLTEKFWALLNFCYIYIFERALLAGSGTNFSPSLWPHFKGGATTSAYFG